MLSDQAQDLTLAAGQALELAVSLILDPVHLNNPTFSGSGRWSTAGSLPAPIYPWL
ncbi:MAG: hypothetical protein Q7T61_20175 [Caulobacter sp.]|nr:hypothetical protein [Caulobacter sp.]